MLRPEERSFLRDQRVLRKSFWIGYYKQMNSMSESLRVVLLCLEEFLKFPRSLRGNRWEATWVYAPQT